MDDFKEMISIQQQFGAIALGHNSFEDFNDDDKRYIT